MINFRKFNALCRTSVTTTSLGRQHFFPFSRTVHSCNRIDKDDGQQQQQTHQFSVMTYNILCQKEANNVAYCKKEYLEREKRQQKIFEELLHLNCDLICLQELDRLTYVDSYSPRLKKCGYESIFLPQGSFKELLRDTEENESHGCAIFYKTEKFKLINQMYLEYNNLVHSLIPNLYHGGIEKVLRRLQNTAILTLLKLNSSSSTQYLGLATTHLFWHPKYEPVKVVQSKILLQQIHTFLRHLGNPSFIPLVIAGDFNSIPGSLVYDLYSTGKVSVNDNRLLFQNLPIVWGDFVHDLNLASAYAQISGEPLFTNYTDSFVGTLDYIWFSKSLLLPLSVKTLISVEEASKERALPNQYYPSDHLSLKATFAFVQQQQQQQQE